MPKQLHRLGQKPTRDKKVAATHPLATAHSCNVEVQSRLRLELRDREGGKLKPASVAEIGELWLERARTEGLEESTTRQYDQHLRLHIAPLIGHRKINSLTAPCVETFKDLLLQTRSRALSRAVLTSLKGILKEAVRRGLTTQNAAQSVQVNRRRRAGGHDSKASHVVQIPSKGQIRLLLATSAAMFPMVRVETTRSGAKKSVPVCWHPFVVTAIFTGMRSSELRGLVWPNVNFERGIIRVSQRADFRNQFGPPKTMAAYRDIPMSPMVEQTLQCWKGICPSTASGLVFPSRNGRVHGVSNIHKQCWRPLQETAGISANRHGRCDAPSHGPRLTFHALRHAAASLFIEQKWTPKKVQSVMGHSSVQVTFDTYGKLWNDDEFDRQSMAQLEAALLATPARA